jgi:flagellar assembly factor FliW
MPVLPSHYFGSISFEAGSVIEFPRGLPGFEQQRRFLLVQIPPSAPVVFLQSTEDPSLCFPALPVQSVDPRYRLRMADEDLELVGLPTHCQPRLGDDVLCLAVLAFRETGPTANLLAPVVVNLSNQRAVQALDLESGYSHQHALFPPEAASCS